MCTRGQLHSFNKDIVHLGRRDYAIQNKQHNHENWECSFHSARGNNSNPKSLWVLEDNCWQLWLQVSRVLNAYHNTIIRGQEAESYFGLMLSFGKFFMLSKLIKTPEKVSDNKYCWCFPEGLHNLLMKNERPDPSRKVGRQDPKLTDRMSGIWAELLCWKRKLKSWF